MFVNFIIIRLIQSAVEQKTDHRKNHLYSVGLHLIDKIIAKKLIIAFIHMKNVSERMLEKSEVKP